MRKLLLLLYFIPIFGIGQYSKNVCMPKVKKLIFDGNSLLARGNNNHENDYASPLACYDAMTGNRPPVFYYPVSGKSVSDLLNDFPTKMAPMIKQGDVVVCNEVVNDLFVTRNPALTWPHILAYRDSVRAHGGKIVWCTMISYYSAVAYPTVETDRLTINATIMANTNQFDGVVDLGSISQFNGLAATQNTTYYNADRGHLQTAGLNLQGQSIQAVIQSFFP